MIQEKKIRKPTVAGSSERETISDAVLDGMTSGSPCYRACQSAGVPPATFARWVDDDPVLAEKYARARDILVEKMACDLLEIADAPVGIVENGGTDSGAVQKQRLQVDARKWLLSKIAPRKYGDKIEVSGGPLNARNSVSLDQRLIEIRKRLEDLKSGAVPDVD
jgi:hypothetical protein